MKEGAVLVIVERFVNLLVPYHPSTGALLSISILMSRIVTPTYRDVDHFQPKRMPHQIVREDGSPLKTRVDPSLPIWICNIEAGNSYGLDLVG